MNRLSFSGICLDTLFTPGDEGAPDFFSVMVDSFRGYYADRGVPASYRYVEGESRLQSMVKSPPSPPNVDFGLYPLQTRLEPPPKLGMHPHVPVGPRPAELDRGFLAPESCPLAPPAASEAPR